MTTLTTPSWRPAAGTSPLTPQHSLAPTTMTLRASDPGLGTRASHARRNAAEAASCDAAVALSSSLQLYRKVYVCVELPCILGKGHDTCCHPMFYDDDLLSIAR